MMKKARRAAASRSFKWECTALHRGHVESAGYLIASRPQLRCRRWRHCWCHCIRLHHLEIILSGSSPRTGIPIRPRDSYVASHCPAIRIVDRNATGWLRQEALRRGRLGPGSVPQPLRLLPQRTEQDLWQRGKNASKRNETASNMVVLIAVIIIIICECDHI